MGASGCSLAGCSLAPYSTKTFLKTKGLGLMGAGQMQRATRVCFLGHPPAIMVYLFQFKSEAPSEESRSVKIPQVEQLVHVMIVVRLWGGGCLMSSRHSCL